MKNEKDPFQTNRMATVTPVRSAKVRSTSAKYIY